MRPERDRDQTATCPPRPGREDAWPSRGRTGQPDDAHRPSPFRVVALDRRGRSAHPRLRDGGGPDPDRREVARPQAAGRPAARRRRDRGCARATGSPHGGRLERRGHRRVRPPRSQRGGGAPGRPGCRPWADDGHALPTGAAGPRGRPGRPTPSPDAAGRRSPAGHATFLRGRPDDGGRYHPGPHAGDRLLLDGDRRRRRPARPTAAGSGCWPATTCGRPPTSACRWSGSPSSTTTGYFRQHLDAEGSPARAPRSAGRPTICSNGSPHRVDVTVDDRAGRGRRVASSTSPACTGPQRARLLPRHPAGRQRPRGPGHHRPALRGDLAHRLRQEAVLGLGGPAMLADLGPRRRSPPST